MLVVPGAEDLIELRAAVLGEGVVRDRGARALRACEAWFTPEQRHEVRSHARLNSDEIKDVLTASYRGLRQSQQARVAALGDGVDVTLARDVFVLRPAPADSGA